MPTITGPRLAVADDRPADLTIRLEGIALDYRDTAEIRAHLAALRQLGLIPRAEWEARPQLAT